MYKVLLADDNKLILERFTKMIDWNENGFKVVSAAKDGMMAWSDFETNNPELVITDIQMPKMTGIELASHIINKAPETVILFLTSYEEFEYVKSALKLGVYGYLLKHETDRDGLTRIVQDVKTEIKKRQLKAKYIAQAALYALIHDLSDDGVSEESLYEYETSLPNKYDLILIEQDHYYPGISELFGIYCEAAVESEIKKVCYNEFTAVTAVVKIENYKYLALTQYQDRLTELAYSMKNELSARLRVTFSLLIIAEDSPILTCAQRFTESAEIIKQKYFSPRSSISHVQYLYRPQHFRSQLDFTQVDALVEERRFDNIVYLIDQYFITIVETRNLGGFEALVRHLTSILMSYDNKLINTQTGGIFTMFGEEDYRDWYDVNSISQWMKRKFADLNHAFSSMAITKYSIMIQRVVKYINENYSNSDLSLDLIAEHLSTNSVSLNAMVKKETGETIWKLIIKVRMDKARELLCAGKDRVKDICKMTGYKDISYFSKVFRDTYGLTPLEYRRSYVGP